MRIMDAPLAKPESKFIPLATGYEGKKFNSPNDLAIHKNGDVYFTDPHFGLVGKENATEKDPWATEYFHRTAAGSGAYKVARWDPGQQIVYERNDDWKGGPLPSIRRSGSSPAASAAVCHVRA